MSNAKSSIISILLVKRNDLIYTKYNLVAKMEEKSIILKFIYCIYILDFPMEQIGQYHSRLSSLPMTNNNVTGYHQF